MYSCYGTPASLRGMVLTHRASVADTCRGTELGSTEIPFENTHVPHPISEWMCGRYFTINKRREKGLEGC